MKEIQPLWKRWIPVVLFTIAFFVRFIGSAWGLPSAQHAFSYHPDETDVWVFSRVVDPLHGQLDPGFYNYGTFYLSLNRLAGDISTQDLSLEPSQIRSLDSLAGLREKAAKQILIGRHLNAVFGALAALLVFMAAGRLFSFWGALGAGSVMTFAPALVLHAHFQTVDTLAMLMVTACLYACVRLLSFESVCPLGSVMKWVVVAGVCAGLAGGTKYNAVLVAFSALLATYLATPKRALIPCATSILAIFVGFLIGTPGVLLNTKQFLTDVRFEMEHTRTGHGLVFTNTSSGYLFHVGNLALCMGFIVFFAGLVGLSWACVSKRKWAFTSLAFVLPYYFLIGGAEVKFVRYVFPLVPVFALGFGWLIAKFLLDNKNWSRIGIGVSILGIGGMLASCAKMLVWTVQLDPRAEASEYLRDKAKYSTVGYATDAWFYTPPLFEAAGAPRWTSLKERTAAMSLPEHPKLVQLGEGNSSWSAEELAIKKPGFVTYSSYEADDCDRLAAAKYKPEETNSEWNRYHRFMEALRKDYEVDTIFGMDSPGIHDMMYCRPMIWIWKRKT